jgi:hypothetical protein
MKSSAQSSLYFSAYPLKALKLPESEESSYLHISSKGNDKKRFNNRLFVMPMADPYREDEKNETAERKNNNPDHLQSFDTEWYNNYE